ncbi:MAG: FHA domain-containing protein [Myxococcales bacterium]|nr:FHA domain-containing protein [Myxococcales bacterium]
MRFVVVRGPELAGPFDLSAGTNVIGRDPHVEVRLSSKRVSRRHCLAIVDGDRVRIKDLDSANGIVDETGQRRPEIELLAGMRVQIGDFVLRLEAPEAEVDLELENDEPATAQNELLLDDEDEDTPIPNGPMPVLRTVLKPAVPDPASASMEVRLPPGLSPSKPPARPPKRAAVPPAFPPPPPPAGPPAQPALPPALTAVPPIEDHPTGETSQRLAPPVLPFGPARGGFGGFTAPPARAPSPPRAPVEPPPFRDDPTPLANQLPPGALRSAAALHPPRLARYANEPPTASEVGAKAQTRLPILRNAEPEREPPAGPPWMVKAAGVMALAGSIVLCAPIGGLFSQVRAASAAAEELSLQRGEALALALGERNAVAVAEGRLVQLDAGFVLHEAGVRDAVVTDVNGTVLAPPERARTSMARAQVLLDAKDSRATERVEAVGGSWEIVAPIRGEVAAGSGARAVVGYAWLQYDPSVAAGAVVSPWLRLAAALFTVGGAAAVLAAGVWVGVLRPLAAVQEETEHALLDNVDKVVSPVRWSALEALVHSINRVVTRARSR